MPQRMLKLSSKIASEDPGACIGCVSWVAKSVPDILRTRGITGSPILVGLNNSHSLFRVPKYRGASGRKSYGGSQSQVSSLLGLTLFLAVSPIMARLALWTYEAYDKKNADWIGRRLFTNNKVIMTNKSFRNNQSFEYKTWRQRSYIFRFCVRVTLNVGMSDRSSTSEWNVATCFERFWRWLSSCVSAELLSLLYVPEESKRCNAELITEYFSQAPELMQQWGREFSWPTFSP